MTSPVGSARPAATAAAPVIAVVATDPRPPTSHTPTRRSVFIPWDPSTPHERSVVPLHGSSVALYAACQDQVCSLEGKTNLSTTSYCDSGRAFGRVRRAAPRPRLSPRPSGRWCSPRRRASATTRSPPGSRRSGGSPPGMPFGWIRRATPAGSPPAHCGATTSSSSSPPPARRSRMHDSAPPSSHTSAEAAATSASTPRRTRAATGPGTSAWSARASSATTAASPAARCRSSTRTTAATRGLPNPWERTDEWYEFRSAPPAHLLARLDESRPLAWCHRYDGGRSVYTAMGHTKESYAEPRFLAHLLGAIEMAAGRARFDCAA